MGAPVFGQSVKRITAELSQEQVRQKETYVGSNSIATEESLRCISLACLKTPVVTQTPNVIAEVALTDLDEFPLALSKCKT